MGKRGRPCTAIPNPEKPLVVPWRDALDFDQLHYATVGGQERGIGGVPA